MARYFLDLSYDGTAYHGWQIQPNGASIQAKLTEALSTLLRTPTSVVGAGRTDAGVHALQMIAHFDAPAPVDTHLLTGKLNRLLPPDIAIRQIRPVRPDAHARFDASSRTYRYYITTAKSPFVRAYRYRLVHAPDYERMNEAAGELFRYTDFTSFSKLHTDVKSNHCRILEAAWTPCDPDTWCFTIRADRFLRNMVRAIVGTLLEVGRGKLSIEEFAHIIEQKDRCMAGSSVPGHALFLVEVAYPDQLFL
ncbi:MAG: tRNA pseudouridine(38-40) synthase TruA [Prevotellaceae bacterium]|nr:tRNA pseudouridine(38-40) synthase TruA [Prevotellaceae bacterium]